MTLTKNLEKNEFELYWAAGFWDGEGCCYLNKKGVRGGAYAKLQLVSIDLSNLERFSDALLLGHIKGPYSQKNKNHSDYYSWVANSFEEVTSAIHLLYPRIGEVKRKQIDRVLKQDTHIYNDKKIRNSKLTEKQVKEIRVLWMEGILTNMQLASKFNVSSNTIYRVASKKSWAHV